MRDWRAGFVLVTTLSLYLPWFFVSRPQFFFYVLPVTPFLVLAAVYTVRWLSDATWILRDLETGTAVETNGLPDRIDLSAELVREAIAAGVAITASTDAHSVRGLDNMRLAVHTARRGWATAANVVNTRPFAEILSAGRTRGRGSA